MSHTDVWTVQQAGRQDGGSSLEDALTCLMWLLGICYLLVLASVGLLECADSGRLFIRTCFYPLAWRTGPRLPNLSWKTLTTELDSPSFWLQICQVVTPPSAVVAAFCKELGHAVNMSWKGEKDFNSGEVSNYFLLCLAFFQCLPERCFLIPLDSLFPTESSQARCVHSVLLTHSF